MCFSGLIRWRKHGAGYGQILFGTGYPVPVTVAAWRPGPGAADYRRLRCEANPFDCMAMLLEAQGIHPRMQGFEALLIRSGRVAAA
jgi:hypothetical protein